MMIDRRDFMKLVGAAVASPLLVNESEAGEISIAVRAVEPKEVVEYLRTPESKKAVVQFVQEQHPCDACDDMTDCESGRVCVRVKDWHERHPKK